MAQIAAARTDQPARVTLGSVVAWESERGVVWHATRQVLRVLCITRGMTTVPLSLANEVALHLPVSLGGWSIAYDELVSWPRHLCCVVGELDDRCLLRILEARGAAKPALFPALRGSRASATPGFAANI